jgi:prepilin-type N-terminal cleavage/methylation domain-containing protein
MQNLSLKILSLKIVSLIGKPIKSKGFTLTESLVSMMILSITLTVMFPAFMIFAMENADKRNMSDAIALSNNVLDNLRRSRITTVPLGNTVTTKEYSGKSYRINQYVCVDLSNVNATTPTCTTTSSNSYPSRDILIRIEKGSSPYEQVYQVETVFSSLR